VLCDWETVNDFLEVLQGSTEYCGQGEFLINQAAAGVWYRARQCGCQRIERRFVIGRDTDVSGVRPSSESCVRWLWLANCYFAHDSLGFPVLLPFFDGQSGRFIPLIATMARLLGAVGVRSIVAESLLLEHQLLSPSIAESKRVGSHPRRLAGAPGASNSSLGL
jgi:hypothetical protein